MAISIWKDTYYEVPASASPFSYRITTTMGSGESATNVTIFKGKAYVAPDEETIKIHVNELCKDYLVMSTPAFKLNDGRSLTMENTEAVRRFRLTNGAGVVQQTYDFVLDWSYDRESYTATTIQSNPINYRLAPNMYQMYTEVNPSTRKSYTYTIRGSSSPISPNVPYQGDYCGHGALYYCNSYGGWDAFLIEGSVKRIDEFNRITINSKTQNGIVVASGNYNTWKPEDIGKVYGKRSYNNQITPSWELKTGFISDSESENLAKNLLRSNLVLFHDLDKDELYPVVLTDTQAEWKTYRNNGRKFVSYTITAQGAQTEQNIS